MSTALYRCFDLAGDLLYVGICKNPAVRCGQHAPEPWWKAVALVTFEWFRTRAQAVEAEKRTIKAEHPKHNVQHNGSRKPYPIRGSKTIPPEAIILCAKGACHAIVARRMGLDYPALRKAYRDLLAKSGTPEPTSQRD